VRKLVIIVPVLFLVILVFGFAIAEPADSPVITNLLNAPAQIGSMDLMIPFAKTSDDGGALGEKAKVKAMREASNSNAPQLTVAGGDGKINVAALTSPVSLIAIREEDV